MRDKRTVNSIKRAFSTDEGIVALEYLAAWARADEADFCEDPRKEAYLCGRRSVVMEIRKILKEKCDE